MLLSFHRALEVVTVSILGRGRGGEDEEERPGEAGAGPHVGVSTAVSLSPLSLCPHPRYQGCHYCGQVTRQAGSRHGCRYVDIYTYLHTAARTL